jgi:hydroxymethylpyrimidine pyrophosphatase-like HAD family hydrolase
MTRRPVSPLHRSAVILDVDGTMATDDKRLTPPAQSAVAELRVGEFKFSMISSGTPRGVGILTAALRVTTPIGRFKGGVIAAADGSVVTAHLLSPTVQQVADFVTDSNDNDGFANAIEHFVLARRPAARPGFARSGDRA